MFLILPRFLSAEKKQKLIQKEQSQNCFMFRNYKIIFFEKTDPTALTKRSPKQYFKKDSLNSFSFQVNCLQNKKSPFF